MLILALACRAPEPNGPTPDPTTPGATATADTGPTAPTPTVTDSAGSDTGSTGDTGTAATVDCANLPSKGLAWTPLMGVVVHEDFAFDDLGNLIAHDGAAFVRQPYPPGAPVPFAPTSGGGGGPASIRRLPSGDFVYDNVDTGSVYRIDQLTGQEILLAGGFAYANGIEVHPNGHALVADMAAGRVLRVDTVTGDTEIAVGGLSSPNGLSFSPDYATLYVGTSFDGLYTVPVDAEGLATGAPVHFADSPGGELLGLGVDACGNVYAVVGASEVWRFPADGSPPILLLGGGQWYTNLQWGSGVGGWEADVLYVNDRFRGYVALEVGVGEKLR